MLPNVTECKHEYRPFYIVDSTINLMVFGCIKLAWVGILSVLSDRPERCKLLHESRHFESYLLLFYR